MGGGIFATDGSGGIGVAWSGEQPHEITFPIDRMVAVGDNSSGQAHIVYSDASGMGTFWHDASGVSEAFSGTQVNCVEWNGRMWVALDNSGNAGYSYDGQFWKPCSTKPFPSSAGLGIAWNGSMWVAVGDPSGSHSAISYSYDGKTWRDVSGAGEVPPMGLGLRPSGFGVAWNGSMWVVGPFNGVLPAEGLYSYDGKTWILIPDIQIGHGSNGGMAWNGRMWVVVGHSYELPSDEYSSIAYSYDGINWAAVDASGGLITGTGVAWNGRMWVAVGSSVLNPQIVYSYDGIHWTPSVTPAGLSSFIHDIAWNGRMWVAVGDDSSAPIYTSPDGINWTVADASGGLYRGYAVAWNKPYLGYTNIEQPTIVLGNGSYNTMAYSPDGIRWTGDAGGLGKLMFDGSGSRAAWKRFLMGCRRRPVRQRLADCL